jgi:uncharacterized membrane protein YtjA (UPF0391 family)
MSWHQKAMTSVEDCDKPGVVVKQTLIPATVRGGLNSKICEGDFIMLRMALVFLLVAILAGVFGLPGVALLSADIARILFIVFLVLFLVAMVSNAMWGRPRDLV